MASVNDYIAGAIAGSVGLIVGHPLDTTKILLQTQLVGQKSYTSYKEIFQSIVRSGLQQGSFRGLAYPLFSIGFINSIYFGVTSNASRYLENKLKNDYLRSFTSGCLGGTAQLVFACPIEVIKVVLQSQRPQSDSHFTGRYFKGPTEAFRFLLKTEGINRLYRGLNIMILRDIPGFGVYILAYESSKKVFLERDYKMRTSTLLAGGFGGVISWCVVMPFDVIKSIMQANDNMKGIIDTAKIIKKKKGFRGFFSGMGITCLRAIPVNAVTFLVFEEMLSLLR